MNLMEDEYYFQIEPFQFNLKGTAYRRNVTKLAALIHFISLLFFILQDCRGDPFLRAEARRTEQ